MALKFILLFVITAGILCLLVLYGFKAGLHMQYLKLKARKDPGSPWDFFALGEPGLAAYRKEALLLFPLLFPVELNETREELNEQKRRIKNVNIALYLLLIILLLAAIYAAKAYPEGLF